MLSVAAYHSILAVGCTTQERKGRGRDTQFRYTAKQEYLQIKIFTNLNCQHKSRKSGHSNIRPGQIEFDVFRRRLGNCNEHIFISDKSRRIVCDGVYSVESKNDKHRCRWYAADGRKRKDELLQRIFSWSASGIPLGKPEHKSTIHCTGKVLLNLRGYDGVSAFCCVIECVVNDAGTRGLRSSLCLGR
jgi:hypothetical protein